MVAGLALKHGVNANRSRRWMPLQRLRSTSALPALLPVTVSQLPADSVVMPAPASINEIELGGAIVRASAAVDEQHLRVVLRALRT